MPQGIMTYGDVVTNLIDGTPVEGIWNEFNQVLTAYNERRAAIQSLFCYNTTLPGDFVSQGVSDTAFELASEFGAPKSQRTPSLIQCGFPRDDYDTATRYTSRFLRDASADQVDAVHNSVIAADINLIFTKTLSAIFKNTSRQNQEGLTVNPLFNGDGTVPPTNLSGQTFSGTHTHYTTSGAATIDSGDLEAVMDTVTEHDYGLGVGSDLVILLNPAEAKVVARAVGSPIELPQ